ncbi:hypothetical protein BKA70DRAFT_1361958 [Coprinopsis sp. MPI-PUGE-AT-0042]|nr:hypothetical protein BKA70DRAFT_1361958 [Coprinopsis sp. MPI-PUGE-AT-0042]
MKATSFSPSCDGKKSASFRVRPTCTDMHRSQLEYPPFHVYCRASWERAKLSFKVYGTRWRRRGKLDCDLSSRDYDMTSRVPFVGAFPVYRASYHRCNPLCSRLGEPAEGGTMLPTRGQGKDGDLDRYHQDARKISLGKLEALVSVELLHSSTPPESSTSRTRGKRRSQLPHLSYSMKSFDFSDKPFLIHPFRHASGAPHRRPVDAGRRAYTRHLPVFRP